MRHESWSNGKSMKRAVLAAVITCVLLPAAVRADDDDWGYGWSSYDALQMQREAQSAADNRMEQEYKQKRADELEQQRKQDAKEHEAYFNDILETSKAASGSPRGSYFRKPGFTSTDAPANPQTTVVNNITFLYDRGVFWVSTGSLYIVVNAPVGAVVDSLPDGASKVLAASGSAYQYYFGVFFALREDGKHEVVKPPAGLLVSYLPDGYQTVQVKGKTMMKYGEAYFQPFLAAGAAVYSTVSVN